MTGEHDQKLQRLGRQFDEHAGFAQLCGIEVELEDAEAKQFLRGVQDDRP